MSNPIKYIDQTVRNAAVIEGSIGTAASIPGVVIGTVVGTVVGTAITVGVVHMTAEHTKLNGSKKRANGKHTKPRPGRPTEKKTWKGRKQKI